jgi:hypothetical protein
MPAAVRDQSLQHTSRQDLLWPAARARLVALGDRDQERVHLLHAERPEGTRVLAVPVGARNADLNLVRLEVLSEDGLGSSWGGT